MVESMLHTYDHDTSTDRMQWTFDSQCSESSHYPLIFGQVFKNLGPFLALNIRNVVSWR